MRSRKTRRFWVRCAALGAFIAAAAAWALIPSGRYSSGLRLQPVGSQRSAGSQMALPMILIRPGDNKEQIAARNPRVSLEQAAMFERFAAERPVEAAKEAVEPPSSSNASGTDPEANTWARDENGELLPRDPYQAALLEDRGPNDSMEYLSQVGQAR